MWQSNRKKPESVNPNEKQYITALKSLGLENADVVDPDDFELLLGKVFKAQLNQPEKTALVARYGTEGGVSLKRFLADYRKQHDIESGPFQPKETYGRRPAVAAEEAAAAAAAACPPGALAELEEKLRDRVALKSNGDSSYRFQTCRRMFAPATRARLRAHLQTFLGFDVTPAEAAAFWEKYRLPGGGGGDSGAEERLDVRRLAAALLDGPEDYPAPGGGVAAAARLYQTTSDRAHYRPLSGGGGGGGGAVGRNPHYPRPAAVAEGGEEDPGHFYLTSSDLAFTARSGAGAEQPWLPTGDAARLRHDVATGRRPGSTPPRPRSAPAAGRPASASAASGGGGASLHPAADAYPGDLPGERRLRRAVYRKGACAGGFQFVTVFKSLKRFLGRESLDAASLRRMAAKIYNVPLTVAEAAALLGKNGGGGSDGAGTVSLSVFLCRLVKVGDIPSGRWFEGADNAYVLTAGTRVTQRPLLQRAAAAEAMRAASWDLPRLEACLREKVLQRTAGAGGDYQLRDAFKLFHPARGPMAARLDRRQLAEVLEQRLEVVPEPALLEALFRKHERPAGAGAVAVRDLVHSLLPRDWDGTNFLTPRDREEHVAYRSLMKRVFGVTGKPHDRGGSMRGVQNVRKHAGELAAGHPPARPATAGPGGRPAAADTADAAADARPLANPALGGTVLLRPEASAWAGGRSEVGSPAPSRPLTPARPASARPGARPGPAAAAAVPARPRSAASSRSGRRPAAGARALVAAGGGGAAAAAGPGPAAAAGQQPLVDEGAGTRRAHEAHLRGESMRGGGGGGARGPVMSPIKARTMPAMEQALNKNANNIDAPETDSIQTSDSARARRQQHYSLKAQEILEAMRLSERRAARSGDKQRHAAVQRGLRLKPGALTARYRGHRGTARPGGAAAGGGGVPHYAQARPRTAGSQRSGGGRSSSARGGNFRPPAPAKFTSRYDGATQQMLKRLAARPKNFEPVGL